MLRKFAAGQKTAPAEIHKALVAMDWETAERLIHTLKGVSGSIGATVVQSRAETVETAIKTRQFREAVDGPLGELSESLQALVVHLERGVPPVMDKDLVTVEEADLKVVCDTLEALLRGDDAEAGNLLESNAGLLRAAFPNHFRKIAENIRAYDFDLALLALKAAVAEAA
jgi:two-component system sensor histidine kinase/response regulator